jgi:prevent-host-death family protein
LSFGITARADGWLIAFRGPLPVDMLTAAVCDHISPCGNLVSMTRLSKSKSMPARKRQRAAAKERRGYWLLQDAKARFSELVRKVRSEGPQHVTVHGRDEVVVIAAEEFRRLKGNVTGEELIRAMQASPYRDIDFVPKRKPMPVRDVSL